MQIVGWFGDSASVLLNATSLRTHQLCWNVCDSVVKLRPWPERPRRPNVIDKQRNIAVSIATRAYIVQMAKLFVRGRLVHNKPGWFFVDNVPEPSNERWHISVLWQAAARIKKGKRNKAGCWSYWTHKHSRCFYSSVWVIYDWRRHCDAILYASWILTRKSDLRIYTIVWCSVPAEYWWHICRYIP